MSDWRDDVARVIAENRDIGWPAACCFIAAIVMMGFLLWLLFTH